MSRIRSKDTKPEMVVRRFLYHHGFRYRLHVKELPGIPDIVLSKYKTVIFVHGCFWHGHVSCRSGHIPKSNVAYWTDKIKANIDRDNRAKSNLEDMGMNVIVIYECELKTDVMDYTLKQLLIRIHKNESTIEQGDEMSVCARTLDDLRKNAAISWPREILQKETKNSVLPLLLQTQDKFISILTLSDNSPDAWVKFVDLSKDIKGNLFLKHLMVLSDMGGEALNKLPPLRQYYPKGEMIYLWNGRKHTYRFKCIGKKNSLTNNSLLVDGKKLLNGFALNDKMKDVIMLLLHGSSSLNDTLPQDVKDKCCIGSLIGKSQELSDFVKQSYIRISRQVSGAQANTHGQIAQDLAKDSLEKLLPGWDFNKNSSLPNVSHTGGVTDTTFDITVKSPSGKYFGIEVSFQVTTNSTIERKAGQAEARAKSVHEAGHKICYIIDGAGNINIRKSAVNTILQYSDCSVAFSDKEFQFLARYMQENS